MVKLQNPNSHLQTLEQCKRKLQLQGSDPKECHKCSFAAPAFPFVSFCLEVEVVDRSGKKIYRILY